MTRLKLASIVITMTESLRQIRLFVAAYEEGSFTAAAHRENATQSGVSQHIHKLEAHFRAELFSRETGAIRPTPAGDLYYRYCIEILRVHEASRNEMKRFGSGLSGEIVVGLMPTMTRSVLGPALATFVSENPNAQVGNRRGLQRGADGARARRGICLRRCSRISRGAGLEHETLPFNAGSAGVQTHLGP